MTLPSLNMTDTKIPELDEATTKALRLPVGVTSPLWLMIGSAAMVGAAFFWATKWMQPVSVETAPMKVLPKPEPEVEAAIEKAAELAPEVVEEAVEAVAEAPVAVVEALVGATPEPEAVIDPVVEAPVVAPAALEPDDLTLMTGIGPKMAAMLAEKGINRFAQIAAWSEDEIATLDKEMKLMGRVAREAWVTQAKRLAGV